MEDHMQHRLEKRLILPLTMLAVAITGCDGSAALRPDVSHTVSTKQVSGAATVIGTTGPGAQYELRRPEIWNGRLVLWAHGYTNPALPLGFGGANATAVAEALVARGYGVARSTFSENGYALKDGVQRTRQLRGLFAAEFGEPSRTYVAGNSLGGTIALMLAESNPGLIDGAVPMCGFLGGGHMQVGYIFNVRLLFDHYFPGVLASAGVGTDPLDVTDGVNFNTSVVPVVQAAMASNPAKAIEMAGVDQIELKYASFPELISATLNAMGFVVQGTDDIVDRLHGSAPIDNTSVMYTGSANDAALNAGIRRYASTPDAVNYLNHYFTPTGRLRIPVLTLHSTRDPTVPFAHEAVYASVVDAAGASDMLVQRTTVNFGHCVFGANAAASLAAQVKAIEDLVAWAEGGPKPLP
jgi:pimeloyl-ACP methyl ester carboxylesterase